MKSSVQLTLGATIALFIVGAVSAVAQDSSNTGAVVAGSASGTISLAEALKKVGKGVRVRVRVMLMMETAPGFIFVRDDTGRMRGSINLPVEMKAGDILEIEAEPVNFRGFAWLNNGTAKVVRHEVMPEPVPMRANEAYSTADNRARLDASYVKLRGIVTAHAIYSDRYRILGSWREVKFDLLEVDDEGMRARVIFHPGVSAWEHFPVGTLADFTGTCRLESKIPEDGAGQIHVLLPDLAHGKVVRLPGLWDRPGVQRALQMALLVLGCALALGLAWALGQRRKVKALRTSEEQLRALSQSLERRVDERTSELAAALTHQTELAKLKTNFVSLVSHEFRTPLGVIMSASDVLHRYFDRLSPEKRARHLDMIISSTRNLAALVEEVLILGRVEEGHLQAAPVPIDLEKLCRALCDEMHSATKTTNPIHFHALTPLDGAVSDPSLHRHIVINLLSNAVKYSEPGSAVEFTIERRDTDAVLTIRDHGIGIPEEDQSRLFTSFTRGSNVGQRPGTGLGLVVVRRCIDQHGGTLELKSTVGAGTTVTVTLPVFGEKLRVEC